LLSINTLGNAKVFFSGFASLINFGACCLLPAKLRPQNFRPPKGAGKDVKEKWSEQDGQVVSGPSRLTGGMKIMYENYARIVSKQAILKRSFFKRITVKMGGILQIIANNFFVFSRLLWEGVK